jgi:anaerobic magnesium-protoporphyrin IX monomethyl ester cyclase
MGHVALIVPFDPSHPANPSNATQPPLRLACMSATTRALGHKVTVIDGVGEGFGQTWHWGLGIHLHGLKPDEVVARVPLDVDVIGVSMMFTQTYPPIREVIRGLRKRVPDAAIIMGGEGVTGIADEVVREVPVDAVVVGEGEGPWIRMLAALEAGESLNNIPNVVTAAVPYHAAREMKDKGGVDHLDQLPWPDWDGIPLETYFTQQKIHSATSMARALPIMASRGCPFKCKFCTAPSTWGSQRYRSPEDVVAEMAARIKEHRIEFFTFNDLSMTTKISWFSDFLDELIRADLNTQWAVPAGIRAQKLSFDLLDRAKRSGMTHLQIAPETGSVRVLDWIDKRFDLKSVEETVVNAKKVGLRVCAYIIVGHPVEEMEDYLLTLRFLSRLAELGVDEIAVSAFTALPGSPFFNDMMEQGRIELNDSFYSTLAQGDLSLQVSNSPHFNGAEVRVLRLQSLLWFYSNRFARHPGELVGLVGRASRDEQATKLDRVLRYEMKSILRGFAPVLSMTSLSVLAQTGRGVVRSARG